MTDTTIQAKVILTALTAGVFPVIRTIYLHEYNPAIPIGRSSKNPLKNLVAATDNCWVDSDVVSRDHALLNFDWDLKRIFIEDTQSMHGTRINNKQIPKNDPIPLANDDVVSLGADVKRGLETYPECRFRVNYELQPYSPSTGRTYQLLSDDEDEPFEISDDGPNDVSPFDGSDDDEIRRNDSLSTSTPESKENTAHEGLDTAGDDDDVIEIEPPMVEYVGSVPIKAQGGSFDEPMEVSDSDSDSIASSDCEPSERPIGRGSSVDVAVECAPIRSSVEADDNNQDTSSNYDFDFSDNISLSGSWPGDDNSDDGSRVGDVLHDFEFGEDDEFDASILDTSVPTEPTANQCPDPNPAAQVSQVDRTITPSTQAPTAPMVPSLVSVEPTTLKPLDLEIDQLPAQARPLSMPSPSDAALKGARTTTPPWRTEKQEFLAARVDNRAKFAAHWMDIGPMKHNFVEGESSAAGGSLGDLSFNANKPDCNSILPGIASLREKPSVQAMLVEPPKDQPLKRKRDEISVYKPAVATKISEFEQSLVAARNIKAISDARAMRSAKAATTVNAHNNTSLAADIHMTTATTTSSISKTPTNADKSTPAAVFSVTPVATLSPSQPDQERPTKRQKQGETKAAAKRFAYATFSGFVAGAGIFAALVATAPDFGGFV
ncbi:hypothetical protein V492_00183 [Pseudogymnoascus sp. VKM F-4246]|nr:hypothetical protein V492_00183 [Pseudogymnoascus sp. VKM F-4246]